MKHFRKVARSGFIILPILFFLIALSIIYKSKLLVTSEQFLTSPLMIIVLMIVFFCAFRFIWNTKHQTGYVQKIISHNHKMYDEIEKTTANGYMDQGVRMQQKLSVANQDQKINNLKGHDYLNALLFSRYRSFFLKKITLSWDCLFKYCFFTYSFACF